MSNSMTLLHYFWAPRIALRSRAGYAADRVFAAASESALRRLSDMV